VLVLTDGSPDYDADLGFPWLEPIYEATVAGLLERLADQPVSGFVLELDKVLHASGAERESLFQLSEAFPLLRVRRSGQGGALAYLDDLERFAIQVRALSPRLARHVPRVPVLLRAVLRRSGQEASSGGVPDGTAGEVSGGLPATFLDLSVCGGALGCDAELAPGEELGVRFLELSDAAPITALVCWSGRRGRGGKRRCAGVRFLDMSPSQARELGERYLGEPTSLMKSSPS